MRLTRLSLAWASMLSFSSLALAQGTAIEVQAGLGYARAFDGGGVSFAAAVERALTAPASPLQQALGLSFWYANTTIASAPDRPDGRELVGLGLRYQVGLRDCCRYIRPFLAVPLEVLRSSIPDQATLLAASLSAQGVPEPPEPTPVEDEIGAAWGWGAGLELGLRVGLGDQLSAHTSVLGLYQDIYASSTRNGAWSWHAGLTYRFGTS